MKKTIFIGKSGCGKTTLIQRLENDGITYRKTQTVEHTLNFIDTPGEYLERRNMYRALIVSSVDADVIGLVQECGEDNTWIPPSFATTFAKPVIGVVSKSDLAQNGDDVRFAGDILQRAGVERVFVVSALENSGLELLMEYLQCPDSETKEGIKP